MKESKFKNKLSAIEVHSVIDKLKDKEPTPAWIKQFKDVLKHYDIFMMDLGELTANSNKRNDFGRKYGRSSLANIISHYATKCNGFTKNGQKTINDHLDVLAEYLINPYLKGTAQEHVPTLKERLEQERAEGKWPSVDERVEKYIQNDIMTTKDLVTTVADETGKSLVEAAGSISSSALSGSPVKLRVKRRKKHKKHHKTKNIYITINIGR